MQIVVLTNDSLKEELLSNTQTSGEDITWIETVSKLQEYKEADVIIDLLFEKEHLSLLREVESSLIIINSVEHTLAEVNTSFVRINGWPTFLKSSIIEASCLDGNKRKKAENIFSVFNKTMDWLPDEPGFVTPRVVGMMVNEAFIALKEGVSTKEEIDTAMKLGTNYPYGPFEWAEKIGIEKVSSLLQALQSIDTRYQSSPLLLQP
jgi:3-hydroxybutyryl-CoA dehydrogenase